MCSRRLLPAFAGRGHEKEPEKDHCGHTDDQREGDPNGGEHPNPRPVDDVAQFEHDEVVLDIVTVFGSTEIRVGEDVRVIAHGTPMLGAFMKVSGMYELDYFKEKMKSVLKKLPPNLIEANMVAIQRAYDEVQ